MPKPKNKFSREYHQNAAHIDNTVINPIFKDWLMTRPDKTYELVSPSSIGKCARCMFYHLKGVKQTTPPGVGSLATFEVGRFTEQAFGKVFADTKHLIHHFQDGDDDPKNQPFTYKHVKGTPDFLLLIDGRVWVADAKTQRSDSFGWTGPSPQELIDDKKEYWAQTLTYIWLLRNNAKRLKEQYGLTDEQIANIGGIVFFQSKDDGIVKREMILSPTDEQLKWVEDRSEFIWGFVERNELPPCECEGWLIGYCGFGNPHTQTTSSTKKIINSECCDPSYVMTGKQ